LGSEKRNHKHTGFVPVWGLEKHYPFRGFKMMAVYLLSIFCEVYMGHMNIANPESTNLGMEKTPISKKVPG